MDVQDPQDRGAPVQPAARPHWEESGVAQQRLPVGSLYVVATPIGNAADLSLRALWVLQHCDAIFAEDTRVTRGLLSRYRIDRPLVAAHAHNEAGQAEAIVARLAAGARVALVTDAGTPAISDPGARIVRAVLAQGHRVVPVPGASSLTAAASAAGLQADTLRFVGFLPDKARARERLLRDLAADPAACVLFEAPHRVVRTARELAEVCDRRRRVVVARELTKAFETIVQSTVGELPGLFEREAPRGEYVLLLDAPPEEAAAAPAGADEAPIDPVSRAWLDALAGLLPPSRVAAVAAQASGIARDRAYAYLRTRHGASSADDAGDAGEAPADGDPAGGDAPASGRG